MFFHVSFHNHGDYFQFQPRVPESAYVHKEGNIPRVCVCPTIYQCLNAVIENKELYSFDVWIKCKKDPETQRVTQPHIYVPIGNQEPYLPPNVIDFRKNDEHWFITPVVMKRIGCLDLVALTKGRVRVTKNILPIDASPLLGEGKDVKIKRLPKSEVLFKVRGT